MADTYLANRNLPPCPNCGRRWSLVAEAELIGIDPTGEMYCSLGEGGCGFHFVLNSDNDVPSEPEDSGSFGGGA